MIHIEPFSVEPVNGYNMLLVGGSGTGKTSVLNYLREKERTRFIAPFENPLGFSDDDLKTVIANEAESYFNEHGVEIDLPVDLLQACKQPYPFSHGELKYALIFAYITYYKGKDVTFIYDEFENGLGHNLLSQALDLAQHHESPSYIMTSNHPYVINNTHRSLWWLVRNRKINGDSIISVTNSTKISALDTQSHHTAFILLINCEEYENGITYD